MKRTRSAVRACMASVACLACLACGRSPDPTFYALSPRSGAAIDTAPLKVQLRRPKLPEYLDRPHLVRRLGSDQLDLAADDRWAAPLDVLVGGTLAENLSQRLPHATVYTDFGAISAPPDCWIEVEISRFEQDADGSVRLTAQVAVHSLSAPESDRVTRHALKSAPVSAKSEAVVAELSALLAQLSDSIARTLPSLPQRPAARTLPGSSPTVSESADAGARSPVAP